MVACPSCLSSNDEIRRFCASCGLSLGDQCCGFINAPNSRYCGGCGRLRLGHVNMNGGVTATGADAAGSIPATSLVEWDEVLAEAAVIREKLDVQSGAQYLNQAELNSMFEG